MNRVILIFLICATCAYLVSGCSHISKSEAVGTYRLSYHPNGPIVGTEILVLKGDGTFTQVFQPSSGKGWTNSGRWELDSATFTDTIIFSNWREAMDSSGREVKPPWIGGSDNKIWISGSEIKIEINPDIPYWYVKVR